MKTIKKTILSVTLVFFRGIISMCEHVAASGNIFIPYSA